MQGQRKHGWIMAKNRSRTVPLVHIKINNYNVQVGRRFPLKHSCSNCRIIKDAKTTPFFTVRVMGPTSKIHPNTRLKCRATGGNRRSNRAARTLNHSWGPGKANLPLLLSVESPSNYLGDIKWIMCQQ